MRHLTIVVAILFSSICYSEEIGRLLWEPGLDKLLYSKMSGEKMLLFPGVPLGGKPPNDAILIGVIDSGVLTTHPQLAGYLMNYRDFTGEGEEDVLGHGTVVTLIALYGSGSTSPPIGILSAKVVDHEGKIKKSHVIEAIDWVVDHHASIVNLSLGFRGNRQEHEELCNAIAGHKEVLFFAAAGNSGPEVQVFPAACDVPNMMSVGASGEDGSPADYSGRGEVMGPGTVKFQHEWAYYYQEAQNLAKASRYSEARRFYERSINAESNEESEFQIGLLDLYENKTDAAIARFKRAIRLEPSFAEAHEMLGAAYFIKGEYSKAEKALYKAIDLYPDTPNTKQYRARAHFNLGQVFINIGHKREAQEEFKTVKQLIPEYPHIDEAINSLY